MTWYLLLPLAALLFKGYWWFASSRYEWADSRWYFLMIVLVVQNTSEVLTYSLVGRQLSPESFAVPYFISLMAVPIAIYALVCFETRAHRLLVQVSVLLCAAMAAAIQFTPLIIVGYVEGSFPVRSIKGEYFNWYLMLSLSFYLLIIIAFVIEYRKSIDQMKRLDIVYALKAFSPFLLVAFYTGGSMLLGVRVNGSGLFPVASSLFMLITIQQRCKSTYLIQSDPRAMIPFSKEWELARGVAAIAFQCIIGNRSLSEAVESMECIMLTHHCSQHQGSKAALARKLGISRPTLDRKLEKHKVILID